MIRIEHEHLKIVYCASYCKIIDYDAIEFAMDEKINARSSFTKEFKLKVVQFF